MKCAEESLQLSTVRVLAERVLPRDGHFVQTDGDVTGTQVPTLDACSLWQMGRVGQLSRKWRTTLLCNTKWRVSGVSFEANESLRRTDGTRGGRFPLERGRRKRRAGKHQREKPWKDMPPRKGSQLPVSWKGILMRCWTLAKSRAR